MSIKLEHCSLTYMQGTPYANEAVKDVTLTIEKGEFVALIGHTGSGKSSLVQLMNGLLTPNKGKVFVDGLDLSLKGPEVQAVKKNVGMVFQYPEQQLFAETVFEDVAFGPRNKGWEQEAVERSVRDAMQFVGLDFSDYKDRNPLQLSGGQKRRVAIAGVVAMNPDYLILDEPSAGLDPRGRKELFREIGNLHKQRGIGIILVTHNMDEAAASASRLLVVHGGNILYDGSPGAVFGEHGPELRQIGLDEPEIYHLAALLAKRGMDVGQVATREALVKAICRVKGW